MRRIAVLSVVFAVCLACVVSADDAKFPYAGKVNAGKVNVRAGAGTNYRILKGVKMGDVLKVLGKSGDWLKISCPSDCKGWVHSNFVKVDNEIGAVIIGNDVNVRATNSTKDVVIAKLNKGDQVTIIRKKDLWYQIQAPENASAWIFGKYVDYVEGYDRFLDVEKKRDKVKALFGELEAEYKKQMGLDDPEMGKIDLLINGYDGLKKITSEYKDPFFRQVAARSDVRLRHLKSIKTWSDRVKAAEAEIAIIERKYKDGIDALNKDLSYTAKGWVEDVGPFMKRPGTHRLKVGGETMYFLKCRKRLYDLNRYVGCYVGITGEKSEVPGRKVEVINIKKIDLLHDRKTDF